MEYNAIQGEGGRGGDKGKGGRERGRGGGGEEGGRRGWREVGEEQSDAVQFFDLFNVAQSR